MGPSDALALQAKNKLGFVNGSIPTPEDSSPNSSQWGSINDMVTPWILNSIVPSPVSCIIYSE